MQKRELKITVSDYIPRGKNKGIFNSQEIKINVSNRNIFATEVKIAEEDCSICLNLINSNHPIWSCDICNKEIHLECAQKWAHSLLKDDNELWSCPSCRSEIEGVPTIYYCYCGKTANPNYQKGGLIRLLPHCCENICGKVGVGRRGKHCVHPCVSPCHKGPCPPCTSIVNVKCPCGNKSVPIQCSMFFQAESIIPVCSNICNKILSCGSHRCIRTCHYDPCLQCEVISRSIRCYCGKELVNYKCGEDINVTEFSCKNICDRELSCRTHKCKELCHPNECKKCPLDPSSINTCHCGKLKLTPSQLNSRKSCLDPVPLCGQICGKDLICCSLYLASNTKLHKCSQKCHAPPCPPCPLTTKIKCICGKSSTSFPCKTIFYDKQLPKSNIRCNITCGKILSCGKHSCGEKCCTKLVSEHNCYQTCTNKLDCGHICEKTCHKKACKPCSKMIEVPIPCTCGRIVVNPPSICSDQFPYCPNLCPLKCYAGHKSYHGCHSSLIPCPPCPVMISKYCSNGHDVLCNIECSVKNVLCTSRCNKRLPCSHLCPRLCHSGSCVNDSYNTCDQSCTNIIKRCGHQCGLKCHSPKPCPKPECVQRIPLYCQCKFRVEITLCHFLTSYQDSIKDLSPSEIELTNNTYILTCNERCKMSKRNYELAKALNIEIKEDSGFISSLNRVLSIHDLKEYQSKNN